MRVGPLKKDPHGRGGRGWEARSVVFYEGLRFWEAHLYVFYEAGRLSGGSVSNGLVSAGGSAYERPSRAWGRVGEGVGGSICRVLRGSEAQGGSFVRVLRGGEALRGLSV